MFESLRPLYPYLRRYWKQFAWGGVTVLLYNALKILIPIIIGHAVDDLKSGVTQHKILLHGGRLVLIAATSAVFLYITRQVLIGASREIEFDLRNDLFATLERQSASFYHRYRTGDIMARVDERPERSAAVAGAGDYVLGQHHCVYGLRRCR